MECAQSFVADAVCNGGALVWEHKEMCEGLAVDEIQSLPAHEIESLETARMKFNAFRESVRKFPYGGKVLIYLGLSEKILQKSWEKVVF